MSNNAKEMHLHCESAGGGCLCMCVSVFVSVCTRLFARVRLSVLELCVSCAFVALLACMHASMFANMYSFSASTSSSPCHPNIVSPTVTITITRNKTY